jgi:hypothetical protein
MAEVFVCPARQLTPSARRELRRAGVAVVEVEQPERCQFIRASEVVSADDMLWAALDALRIKGAGISSDGVRQREQLALNLFAIVDAARTRRTKAEEAS